MKYAGNIRVRELLVLVSLAIVLAIATTARADTASLLRGLDSDDPQILSAGIAAIERAPASPELADVLFAAGRAAEDRLHDPARALSIYERILRELPDASAAIAAERRAQQLRGMRAYAREAADLAELIANADRYPPAEVARRADALAQASWPGALEAALWIADWSCRTGKYADADRRYRSVLDRAPGSPQAQLARRNAAGCALDAGDWSRAEDLANALPRGDLIDDSVRVDLVRSARTGRRLQRLYLAAWIVLVCTGLGLLASLAEAMLRGGWRAPGLAPPIEVFYLAPLAIALIIASFAIDSVIGPTVTAIGAAGVVVAWTSGMTLDLLRKRQRDMRLRAVSHVVGGIATTLSIGYIAIYRGGLIDMFIETVRFGPGA
jgi:tetratricopeptide (TPR) repeat protein